MGRFTAAGAASPACFVDHGVPWFGARRAQAQAGRNERSAARDGGSAQFRSVQSRPADLRRAEADRYRAAVRQAIVVVPAKAGTHTPQSIERLRSMGPGIRSRSPGTTAFRCFAKTQI